MPNTDQWLPGDDRGIESDIKNENKNPCIGDPKVRFLSTQETNLEYTALSNSHTAS